MDGPGVLRFLRGQLEIQDGRHQWTLLKYRTLWEKCKKKNPPLKPLGQFKASTVQMALRWS